MTNSKEYNAKYYQEHKQEIVEKKKKHYEEHKGEILARNRKWIEDNREQWNEYMRERRKKLKSIDTKDNTINFEFVERPLDYDEAEEAEQDLAFLFGGEK